MVNFLDFTSKSRYESLLSVSVVFSYSCGGLISCSKTGLFSISKSSVNRSVAKSFGYSAILF